MANVDDVRAIATLRSRITVQAGAGPLTGKSNILQSEQDILINDAIRDYSMDEPRPILLNLAESALTTVSNVKFYKLASWDPDVSSQADLEIEFPIDQAVRRLLLRGHDMDFEVVERPTGAGGAIETWVKFYNAPSDSGGNWRIRYSARWSDITEEATLATLGRRQVQMIGLLAAVYCARFLAVYYGKTDDATIAADSVNYRTKADEWMRIANELWKEYQDRIDRPSKIKRPGQDIDVVDLDLSFNRSTRYGGREYLVHRRRRR